MIDVMIRAETRARFRTFALNRNLVTQTTDLQGNTIYPTNPGVDIDQLGNVVITPAVMDGMTVVTPAVVDTWFVYNVRLSRQRADDDADTLYTGETEATAGTWKFLRSKIVRYVREQATQVTSPWGGRAYQFGTTPNRLQVLDPRDLPQHAPKQVWLGGMNL